MELCVKMQIVKLDQDDLDLPLLEFDAESDSIVAESEEMYFTVAGLAETNYKEVTYEVGIHHCDLVQFTYDNEVFMCLADEQEFEEMLAQIGLFEEQSEETELEVTEQMADIVNEINNENVA